MGGPLASRPAVEATRISSQALGFLGSRPAPRERHRHASRKTRGSRAHSSLALAVTIEVTGKTLDVGEALRCYVQERIARTVETISGVSPLAMCIELCAHRTARASKKSTGVSVPTFPLEADGVSHGPK